MNEELGDINDADLRKRAKYIKECKQRFWTRWKNEYLKNLRERHTAHSNQATTTVKVGDVMIIKGDEKNRGKWKLGIVNEVFPGRDGVVRGVRLRAGKSYLDRAVQHLYPLELSSGDMTNKTGDDSVEVLDDKKPAYQRPSRMAAKNAREKMKGIHEDEEDDNDIAW